MSASEAQLKDAPARRPAIAPARRLALRAAAFAALWLALTRGDLTSLIVGLPAIALAAWLSTRLADAAGFRLQAGGLLRFVVFFLVGSVRGGADVAFRALHRRMPIRPALLRHPLALPEGAARRFFMLTVNLMPGTLSADVEDATLVVHMIDDSPAMVRGVAALEQRVAAMFDLPLAAEGGAPS